jgi:hypothetical protein
LRELAAFPLVDALYGRRSRRFALGSEIPDGPLAYKSSHEPLPLTQPINRTSGPLPACSVQMSRSPARTCSPTSA